MQPCTPVQHGRQQERDHDPAEERVQKSVLVGHVVLWERQAEQVFNQGLNLMRAHFEHRGLEADRGPQQEVHQEVCERDPGVLPEDGRQEGVGPLQADEAVQDGELRQDGGAGCGHGAADETQTVGKAAEHVVARQRRAGQGAEDGPLATRRVRLQPLAAHGNGWKGAGVEHLEGVRVLIVVGPPEQTRQQGMHERAHELDREVPQLRLPEAFHVEGDSARRHATHLVAIRLWRPVAAGAHARGGWSRRGGGVGHKRRDAPCTRRQRRKNAKAAPQRRRLRRTSTFA
mmetsp:Transcript_122037/g.341604  ORF Transcript_122037/g.341604 Transcript_122037/m.341604 type:complete len:287 (+) Transcript_122037:225-1085(+)